MKSNIPDDLLSAFSDGEVSPEEEAAARNRLQASPQARQELQDYERLSAFLHALPRHSLPPEFASAVMQQAERETLIPLETAGVVVCDSHLERPSRVAWILTGLGAVAAAVLMLFFVPLANHKEEPALVLSGAPAVASSRSPTPQGRPAPVAPARAKSRMVAASESVAAVKFGEVDADKLGLIRGDGQKLKESVSIARPTLAAVKNSELVFPADLKTVRSGDVIEALEKAGDQVAVVRLTVMNQTDGLDGLQSLLVRNGSRPVQGPEKTKVLREWFEHKKAAVSVDDRRMPGAAGDLICVYVEGSREQLAGVLKDMQKETHIQQAELTNTISAAKLAQYANPSVTSSSAARDVTGSGQTVLSLPVATVDQIVGKNPSRSPVKPRRTATQGPPARNDTRQLVAATQRSQVFFVIDEKSIAQSELATPAPASPAPPSLGSDAETALQPPAQPRRPVSASARTRHVRLFEPKGLNELWS